MTPPTVNIGTEVYTSDGHKLGKVTEATNDEIFVEESGLLKHTTRSFPYSAIATTAADRITLNVDADYVKGTWNEETLQDAHGRDRHVIQVGTPRRIPTYDEVQTTTGGPPTGEFDEEK